MRALLLVACTIMLGALLAAVPASEPSASVIRSWFEQLADPDPQIRDQATQSLMGLDRNQLPELRNAVADSLPLRPSQAVALRDIVLHVYLSGMSYIPEPGGAPFLGLSWNAQELYDVAESSGVVVVRRVPGFGAYRMLRDGDIITQIEERPGERFDNTVSFGQAILSFRPGDTITLRVVRSGKTLRIAVQLRARPLGITTAPVDAWIQQQQELADQYWDKTFASIVGKDLL